MLLVTHVNETKVNNGPMSVALDQRPVHQVELAKPTSHAGNL